MSKYNLSAMKAVLTRSLSSSRVTPKILKALELAYYGHNGQYREPRTPEQHRLPYITHPVDVAIFTHKYFGLVKLNDTHEDVIMIALTHDLLEDTDVTLSELESICSKRVAEVVQSLTKPDVKSGETHDERNIKFIKQIEHAGDTAMFVKICDSMHNMSKPAQTPIKLLRKAIKKSRRDYMGFFEEGLNSESLKSAYTTTINFAQQKIQNINHIEENQEVYSLNEAIAEAVVSSERKTLELHDILEILEKITHPSYTLVASPKEILDQIFFDITGADQKTKAVFLKKMESGSALLSDLPRKCRKDGLENVEKIFFIETSLSKRAQLLALGYDKDICPGWVNLESLKIIFGFLSERLRNAKRSQFITLSADAAALGFNLVASDLEKAGVEHKDLIELNHLLTSARYIQGIIDTEIQRYLSNSEYLSEILSLKKRLKEPKSIIMKIQKRGFDSIADIDDIVGFRLICLNSKAQLALIEKIKVFFEKILPEKFNCLVKSNGAVPQLLVTSKAGYKARHMLYSIDLGSDHEFRVNCEIQIRTIFEDAWAKFSNSVSYKKDTTKDKLAQEKLGELAKIRDRADSIADYFE